MGLDPMSAITGTLLGIATNLATDILKHYAQKLDGTLVGRGLKQIGLIETTRDDHLRKILEESLQLYFKKHPWYDISGVIDFFHDPVTSQQIGNYIFDHRPTDEQAIETALVKHLRNDPYSLILLRQRGGEPERLIPDFLACYRSVLMEHPDAGERAILLTVLDAADTVIAEIRASEARMKTFVTQALGVQAQALTGNMPPLDPGKVIGGRYRIQSYLTTGTFGSLYRAELQDTGTLVVLKIVNVPQGLRLRQDVFSLDEHLVNLHHPSILPTLDVHLDDIPPYIVSAYADGGSLQNRIHRHAPHALPLQEAISIVTQVGEALSYLHQHNIIHRAVQPASILFDNTDKALLTGFDLAMMAFSIRHFLPMNPVAVGAINYMAPEQLRGSMSEKSDQYALGCIAYELCTGRFPFREPLSPSTPQRQLKPPLAPHSLNPEIPPQVEHAILRAISANPDQRYNNMSAFVKDVANNPS